MQLKYVPFKSTSVADYKVKLSLCLMKHHGLKAHGRIASCTLELDTRWVLNDGYLPALAHFIPRVRASGTHWTVAGNGFLD